MGMCYNTIMSTPTFRAKIDHKAPLGFRIIDTDRVQKYCVSKKDGTFLRASLKIASKQRSSRQNRYYWGVVIYYISEEIGLEPNDAHLEMKKMFLRDRASEYEIQKKLNKQLPFIITRSTTSLSTLEFIDYIDRVVRWASNFLSIYIPDPNQVEF